MSVLLFGPTPTLVGAVGEDDSNVSGQGGDTGEEDQSEYGDAVPDFTQTEEDAASAQENDSDEKDEAEAELPEVVVDKMEKHRQYLDKRISTLRDDLQKALRHISDDIRMDLAELTQIRERKDQIAEEISEREGDLAAVVKEEQELAKKLTNKTKELDEVKLISKAHPEDDYSQQTELLTTEAQTFEADIQKLSKKKQELIAKLEKNRKKESELGEKLNEANKRYENKVNAGKGKEFTWSIVVQIIDNIEVRAVRA